MALPSTTSDPVTPAADKQELEEPQLDEQETQTEADNSEEDTSQTSESDETTPGDATDESVESDNVEDSELKEWAAKKNLPLDDPLKIAKMYRESEKQLGKKGQQEGQLKSAVTEANNSTSNDEVQALRNEMEALSFWISHPNDKQYEQEMVTILEDKPWLANDLETVLYAAKGKVGNLDVVAAKNAGKQEARAAAEQAGRAAQPRASATNSAMPNAARITPENVDAVVAQHMGDTKWYEAHKEEINRAVAG